MLGVFSRDLSVVEVNGFSSNVSNLAFAGVLAVLRRLGTGNGAARGRIDVLLLALVMGPLGDSGKAPKSKFSAATKSSALVLAGAFFTFETCSFLAAGAALALILAAEGALAFVVGAGATERRLEGALVAGRANSSFLANGAMDRLRDAILIY